MQKLLKAKAHMGFSSTYSDTQPYIYGFRNKIAIIDLEKTLISLRRACNVIDLIIGSKGHLLFVNTNPEYNKIIQETAQRANQSYINHKWIGGFLTNWNHMQNVQQHFMLLSRMASRNAQRKIIDRRMLRTFPHFMLTTVNILSKNPTSLSDPRANTAFITPRFKKMQKCFEGLRNTQISLPDCVIFFNANQNSIAIHEANLLQIPIISIVDSNISNKNHSLITYPIPANENSVRFIYIVCNCFLKTILRSRFNLE